MFWNALSTCLDLHASFDSLHGKQQKWLKISCFLHFQDEISYCCTRTKCFLMIEKVIIPEYYFNWYTNSTASVITNYQINSTKGKLFQCFQLFYYCKIECSMLHSHWTIFRELSYDYYQIFLSLLSFMIDFSLVMAQLGSDDNGGSSFKSKTWSHCSEVLKTLTLLLHGHDAIPTYEACLSERL